MQTENEQKEFSKGETLRQLVRHLGVLGIGLVFGLLTGCSSQVDPPSFENPAFRTINYELCKSASFDLKHQTPKGFRALIQCVNGQDKVIQPYVDFVNAISDEDLKVYISSFEEHFSPYLNQALDVMNRMQERGLLRAFSKNIAVLAETSVLSSGIELWQKVYEENGGISPAAMAFHDFLSELIARDRLRNPMRGVASIVDNPHAWALAHLLSKKFKPRTPQG